MSAKNLLTRKIFGFELYVLALFFLVFTIPWGNNLNSQAIILFCVITLLTPTLSEKKRRLKSNYLWIFFTTFFFIIACSLFWDSQPFSSLKPLEKYAAFLFLPPILTAMPKLTIRSLKTCLLVFVTSSCIVLSICYVKSAIEYLQDGDYRVFHYHYLSEQMDLNAIYLSLYCCFSIVILIYYFFISAGKQTFITRLLILFLCVILAMSIILLSAKMVIAILAMVIISLLLYIGFLKGQLLKSAVLILLITIAGVVAIGQIHYVRWRIGVTLLKKYEGAEDNQNGLAVRQMLWQSAVELIRERPIFGFGIQSAEIKLLEKYKEKDFEYGLTQRYNAHNTYLQVALHCGITGLIVLFLLLGVTIQKAISQKNFFLLFLLLIILPQSITESMFEVQKGIVFFVTFVSLLANHAYIEKIAPRSLSQDSKQAINV